MPRMSRRVYDPSDDKRGVERTPDPDLDLKKLKARINELESEVAAIGMSVAPQDPQREDSGPVNRDSRWHCKKCGYLLAFYDLKSDVMRTRYKEHIVYIRAGEGGFVQILCRGCAEVNTQEYVASTGSEAPAPE